MSSGGGMEVEVRVVGGARSCFVALPLHLIHALERTSASGDLPPVLALDLRTAAGGRWSLAWSGAASRSRAIEVSTPTIPLSEQPYALSPWSLLPNCQSSVELMLVLGN
jgi:hypothetical protein